MYEMSYHGRSFYVRIRPAGTRKYADAKGATINGLKVGILPTTGFSDVTCNESI